MHINHEIVINVILSREGSVVNYQECYEEKETKIEVVLNATIMIKLIRCRMDNI